MRESLITSSIPSETSLPFFGGSLRLPLVNHGGTLRPVSHVSLSRSHSVPGRTREPYGTGPVLCEQASRIERLEY